MSDNPRIAELRRRVESDPASIAFAQLAEEYRREGEYEQAIQVCRTGLAQYPSYLSARVTLGRALTELGRVDEAKAEIERVLQVAPDNIAAKRAMDDLRDRAAQHPSFGTAAAAPPPAPLAGPPPDPRIAATDAPPSSARSPERNAPIEDPAIAPLEAWLEAILRDRARRAGGHAAR